MTEQVSTRHTPTPWWYDDRTDHGSPLLFAGAKGDKANPVVAFHQADYDSEAWFECSDEDAAFIVRAVNAHDALLAACEALVKADWCIGYEVTEEIAESFDHARMLALAAIALATGTSDEGGGVVKAKKEKKSFERDTVVMREWLANGCVSTDELVRELELWLEHFKEVTK